MPLGELEGRKLENYEGAHTGAAEGVTEQQEVNQRGGDKKSNFFDEVPTLGSFTGFRTDDVSPRQSLEKIVRDLAANPEVELCYLCDTYGGRIRLGVGL